MADPIFVYLVIEYFDYEMPNIRAIFQTKALAQTMSEFLSQKDQREHPNTSRMWSTFEVEEHHVKTHIGAESVGFV